MSTYVGKLKEETKFKERKEEENLYIWWTEVEEITQVVFRGK